MAEDMGIPAPPDLPMPDSFGGGGKARGGDRRILIITIIVVVIIFISFLFTFRSCNFLPKGDDGYVTIYSNLDLKDAANVVTRLKELKVPYKIKDGGRAVTVQKSNENTARLGLAEKNLPLGGAVGWEIFDEARLGATDFDRRIQLIRAISGELSRTIRSISGVHECRVQIVLPETRLFDTNKAPVTASVLLTLSKGFSLSPGQVNGIINLVASSVENLQPQNVTIVDNYGRILSINAKPRSVRAVYRPEVVVSKPKPTPTPVQIKKAEPEKKLEQKKVLSREEMALLRVKGKEQLEKDLSVSTQHLLNRFFPPNSIVSRVNIELFSPSNANAWKAPDQRVVTVEGEDVTLYIKKIYAIILLDEKIGLSKDLKSATYAAIASEINYNKKRGDRIVLRRVPFFYATEPASMAGSALSAEATGMLKKPFSLGSLFAGFLRWGLLANIIMLLVAIGILYIFFMIFRGVFGKGRVAALGEDEEEVPLDNKTLSSIEVIKRVADEEPEKIADLLKTWMQEE